MGDPCCRKEETQGSEKKRFMYRINGLALVERSIRYLKSVNLDNGKLGELSYLLHGTGLLSIGRYARGLSAFGNYMGPLRVVIIPKCIKNPEKCSLLRVLLMESGIKLLS